MFQLLRESQRLRKKEKTSSPPGKNTLGRRPAKSSFDSGDEYDVLHVRRVVAGNPNTPQLVLDRLAYDEIAIIRKHVAENPRTSVDVLRRLAQDSDPDVRLAVAENAYTPPETLATLAGDSHLDVRYGVAENPHMPQDILLQLTRDENPYIRCRALKTLSMLSPDIQNRLKLLVEYNLPDSQLDKSAS
jgi:hypothetical protein